MFFYICRSFVAPPPGYMQYFYKLWPVFWPAFVFKHKTTITKPHWNHQPVLPSHPPSSSSSMSDSAGWWQQFLPEGLQILTPPAWRSNPSRTSDVPLQGACTSSAPSHSGTLFFGRPFQEPHNADQRVKITPTPLSRRGGWRLGYNCTLGAQNLYNFTPALPSKHPNTLSFSGK